MYWAIVTVSTVGYGDISPHTPAGKFIASMLMIIGYGIIAVPTGIISHEIAQASKNPIETTTCPRCLSIVHGSDANYCYKCGEKLQG
jgi:voltage-gated potassium channel